MNKPYSFISADAPTKPTMKESEKNKAFIRSVAVDYGVVITDEQVDEVEKKLIGVPDEDYFYAMKREFNYLPLPK